MLYVDSNVLIGTFELGLGGTALAHALLMSSQDSPRFITSEITVSEVLVAPFRSNDLDLVDFYHALFSQTVSLAVEPVTRGVLERAARLRAVSSMKLPDAIHVATAALTPCSILLSRDQRLFIPSGMRRLDPFAQPLDLASLAKS
ncbi:type II toxin-antitoxin system VapC family toxin [uncultured Enterovirga sp.]|uniref:type II toxin-antitoxin system VapC family toxin n=1 Tax=uncultured Enterovirga sp. TaxID=2026352 RepID=UPI0035C99D5D